MRREYRRKRISVVAAYLSTLAMVCGGILLIPFFVGLVYGEIGMADNLVKAFLYPGIISIVIGIAVSKITTQYETHLKDAMAICVLGWVMYSMIGAVPYVVILKIPYLNAVFETMSGFTTTGITLLTGLDSMPRSILFWRAFTQWLGGLGILSMFIFIGFKGGSAASKLFSAESHKISSSQPHPGIYNTVKTFWKIYIFLSIAQLTVLLFLGLGLFDALTHTFTTLSTGGFSIYDSSIAHYGQAGFGYFNYIELVYMFFMVMGGLNFFIHYNIWTGNIKSLWEDTEARTYLLIILSATGIIFLSYALKNGVDYTAGEQVYTGLKGAFYNIKDAGFQVISILTTTGYATRDINSAYFTALARQIFLVFMVIGGCSGSTGGGFKIIRVVTLFKVVKSRLFKLNTSYLAQVPVTIKNKIIRSDEIQRITVIFVMWIAFLIAGGGITAFFSDLSGWASFSGMFSALGNIGPSFITIEEMVAFHPAVKITYIIGMLAGRLEIIPVILLFSGKFYK
ncbi:MAG: TrkH family potassium uptake protein [Elusimicrobiota bacterium]